MINERLATLDDLSAWQPAAAVRSLRMLRLDKLHPLVSGNKWYKLKHSIAAARQQGKSALLSFGGGHSNHLLALAVAAKECGMGAIGIVHGVYSGANVTDTLRHCERFGMRLVPLSKSEYAAAKLDASLAERFPGAYLIPEGGANEAGIRGAAEIARLIPQDCTDVCVAVGTGTTFLGLHQGLPASIRLHGFYVAKDFERADAMLSKLPAAQRLQRFMHPAADSHFGKWTNEMLAFMRSFYAATGIPLDVVYTSKMMLALRGLLDARRFSPDACIVCIHTGGLQGNPAGLFSETGAA